MGFRLPRVWLVSPDVTFSVSPLHLCSLLKLKHARSSILQPYPLVERGRILAGFELYWARRLPGLSYQRR
jgi:hypothetical protein